MREGTVNCSLWKLTNLLAYYSFLTTKHNNRFLKEVLTLYWELLKFVLCILSLEQPSEQNTYYDIEAVYRCLGEKYGVKEEDVILYGQSVGSGPTLDLATRLPRLRAVILHSPIMSGLRVMYPVKRTYWFDIYKVFTL